MTHRVLLAVVALGLLSSLTVVPTAAAPSCDFVGSNERDVYAGDQTGETICLLDGDDYAHGNGGRDRIRGGPGSDSLVAGQGRDRLKGGPGNDRLFATDQRTSNDILRGGAGIDQCFADPSDTVRGCEAVFRGNVPATTEALTANSFDVTEIAEEALEVLPPGIPGPIGPTGPGAVIPPQNPPPCPPPPPPADPACD